MLPKYCSRNLLWILWDIKRFPFGNNVKEYYEIQSNFAIDKTNIVDV